MPIRNNTKRPDKEHTPNIKLWPILTEIKAGHHSKIKPEDFFSSNLNGFSAKSPPKLQPIFGLEQGIFGC
jgi:hypothetical protein